MPQPEPAHWLVCFILECDGHDMSPLGTRWECRVTSAETEAIAIAVASRVLDRLGVRMRHVMGITAHYFPASLRS